MNEMEKQILKGKHVTILPMVLPTLDICEKKERDLFVGRQHGSGLSYASCYMAEKIAEKLGTEFKLKDCVVLDDVATEDIIKPKKYIYTTIHTTRASILKNLVKKNE